MTSLAPPKPPATAPLNIAWRALDASHEPLLTKAVRHLATCIATDARDAGTPVLTEEGLAPGNPDGPSALYAVTRLNEHEWLATIHTRHGANFAMRGINAAAHDPYGLTEKQRETILTAHEIGFYNTPRDSTLDDLSRIFGISKAAAHNRLQAAERKVIARFAGIQKTASLARAAALADADALHVAARPRA